MVTAIKSHRIVRIMIFEQLNEILIYNKFTHFQLQHCLYTIVPRIPKPRALLRMLQMGDSIAEIGTAAETRIKTIRFHIYDVELYSKWPFVIGQADYVMLGQFIGMSDKSKKLIYVVEKRNKNFLSSYTFQNE